MKQLDSKKLHVNIVAAIGLAENHISGESYKPSDIMTAYNGKTVDIIHTDAEGRLVMADVMSYISDKYTLNKMMTVATLT
jgi:leucyl aminopeptidase